MLSLYDPASREEVLHPPLAANLRSLVERRHHAKANGLPDLIYLLVVEAGDIENAIIHEIGWSPLVDPFNEAGFEAASFRPYWNGPSQEDGEGTLPELLSMCSMHAEGAAA